MASRVMWETFGDKSVSKSFSDLTVKKLPIGKHFDASTPGFGIRVGKSKRTWVVMRGRQRQLIRVGHYPAMSLSEARTKGKQLLAATQLNHDRVSFEQAYELYKKTQLPQLKARTQSDYTRYLDRYYLPTLAKRRLDAITSHMLDAITDELVATPTEQSHAIAYGKTFFKWCVRRRYIGFSPLDGTQLPKAKRRKRVLTDVELRAVWEAARGFNSHYGSIIKILILTGMRRGEAAAIRASWIQEHSLTVPKEITKNGRELLFPLSPMLAKLLAHALEAARSPYQNDPLLFPAANYPNQPFSGFSQSKKNIDKLLTIAKWQHHDLRRTYRTNLGRLRVAPHIAERLVNHVAVQNEVEAIYDVWTYFPEMQEAQTTYENWLTGILS